MKGFYGRYFEGYEEYRVMKGSQGKVRREFRYVGDYYRHALSRRLWVELKMLYALLTAGSAALYLHASTMRVVSNQQFYVAFFQSLAVIGNIWYIWVLANYLAAPRDMKIYEFKSTSRQLKRSAPLLAGVYALTALGVLVSLVMNGEQRGLQALCLAEDLLAGALLAGVFFLERRVEYKTIPNAQKGAGEEV